MHCRTPSIAEESAAKIFELYEGYKEQNDFVGMDMARKFLQMGYTRAMRYAKHKGGRKYDSNHELLPESVNEEKIECAQVRQCVKLADMHISVANLNRHPMTYMADTLRSDTACKDIHSKLLWCTEVPCCLEAVRSRY